MQCFLTLLYLVQPYLCPPASPYSYQTPSFSSKLHCRRSAYCRSLLEQLYCWKLTGLSQTDCKLVCQRGKDNKIESSWIKFCFVTIFHEKKMHFLFIWISKIILTNIWFLQNSSSTYQTISWRCVIYLPGINRLCKRKSELKSKLNSLSD